MQPTQTSLLDPPTQLGDQGTHPTYHISLTLFLLFLFSFPLLFFSAPRGTSPHPRGPPRLRGDLPPFQVGDPRPPDQDSPPEVMPDITLRFVRWIFYVESTSILRRKVSVRRWFIFQRRFNVEISLSIRLVDSSTSIIYVDSTSRFPHGS